MYNNPKVKHLGYLATITGPYYSTHAKSVVSVCLIVFTLTELEESRTKIWNERPRPPTCRVLIILILLYYFKVYTPSMNEPLIFHTY